MEKQGTSRPEELDHFAGRMRNAAEEASGSHHSVPDPSENEASAHSPGPLEDEKRADDPGLGDVEPQAAEVESARLLVNDARAQLQSEGLSEEDLRRLADEFIARDRGDEVASFVDWARHRARNHAGEPPPP